MTSGLVGSVVRKSPDGREPPPLGGVHGSDADALSEVPVSGPSGPEAGFSAHPLSHSATQPLRNTVEWLDMPGGATSTPRDSMVLRSGTLRAPQTQSPRSGPHHGQ